MSKLFKINTEDVKSALVSAVFMSLIAVLLYVKELGSIWAIDLKEMANVGVMAGIVYLISIGKNFLTNSEGKFVGAIKIK